MARLSEKDFGDALRHWLERHGPSFVGRIEDGLRESGVPCSTALIQRAVNARGSGLVFVRKGCRTVVRFDDAPGPSGEDVPAKQPPFAEPITGRCRAVTDFGDALANLVGSLPHGMELHLSITLTQDGVQAT